VELTIQELTETTGVTRRTLRYYIAMGVLMAPRGVGKGARYTEEHVDRVGLIRQMQLEGQTLDQIKLLLESGSVEEQTDPWVHLSCPDDMRVLIRMDLPAERSKQLKEAVAAMVMALEGGE